MAQIRAKGLRDFGASLDRKLPITSQSVRKPALRLERECVNVEADPRVVAVYYPGLPSHPQHALATGLFRAYGSLLSFELQDGIDCFDYLNRLQLAVASSNLGDTRTLVVSQFEFVVFLWSEQSEQTAWEWR